MHWKQSTTGEGRKFMCPPPMDFNTFEVQLYKNEYDPMDVFYLFFGMLRSSMVGADSKMKWILLRKEPPSNTEK